MNSKMKWVLFLIILIAIVILCLRIFSQEDDWVCQRGEWVKHGNPTEAIPNRQCLK